VVDLADCRVLSLESGEILSGPGAKAANSFEQPDLIRSQPWGDVEIVQGQATLELPALSVVALTWQIGPK